VLNILIILYPNNIKLSLSACVKNKTMSILLYVRVNDVFGFRFVGTDNRSESPEMNFRPENAFHATVYFDMTSNILTPFWNRYPGFI